MSEIDELVERGVLDESESRVARAEAGRRILSAADRGEPETKSSRPGWAAAAAILIAVPAAAVGVYLLIGSPGTPDQPFAARLAAWRQTDPRALDPARVAAVLKEIVRERPGDVQGLRFLAEAQLASGDVQLAVVNLRRAVSLAPERAELWSLLGNTIVVANEGAVTPEALAAFQAALERDPASPGALYYSGRARIQAGELDEGLAIWRALLQQLPEDAESRQALSLEIAEVEQTGRLPGSGVSAQQPAEIEAAVRGMVEGLAARLAANPDDAQGWIRLVRAYTVLGDTARRDEALETARARYGDQPEILTALAQAMEQP
jgi:cytochrome c-type biogenesis protein CcmH